MSKRSVHARRLAEVAIEVVQGCLFRLGSAHALADMAVVHDIRVATKRLRAAWRLAVEQAGPERAKARRRALSDLAAKLSGTRDLAVLTRLTQRLATRQTDDRIATALAQLAIGLAQRHAAAERSVHNPRDLLDAVRSELAAETAAWLELAQEVHPARHKGVRRELRRSRRRARRTAREASRSEDADLWHDWRKAVKRLRYQRQFIAMAEDAAPGKLDPRMDRLGKRLGKRHDLANLTRFADVLLATGDLTADHHGLVRTAIATVESGLIRRCRRLGQRSLLRPVSTG